MVICLERDADLRMAQLMLLPLTVSCVSRIQIGFTFLVPAHPGSPGKRAVSWVCVCVCVLFINCTTWFGVRCLGNFKIRHFVPILDRFGINSGCWLFR